MLLDMGVSLCSPVFCFLSLGLHKWGKLKDKDYLNLVILKPGQVCVGDSRF